MQQGEIKRHARKMRKIYQSRRDFAVMTFQQVFQNKVEISTPAGGMALWVRFNLAYQTQYTEALSHFQIDSEYCFGSRVENTSLEYFHIRFGFAALNETEITKIIQTLHQIFMTEL